MVVVPYLNSLDNPFIWDDRNAIVDNPTIRTLWPLWTPLLPPAETPVSSRPLVNLSFALNYALHGLDVRGYHLVNLGLHPAHRLPPVRHRLPGIDDGYFEYAVSRLHVGDCAAGDADVGGPSDGE